MGNALKPARACERAQLRQPGAREWTQAKRNVFLAELTQTANVAHSARAVGFTKQGAYQLRKRDPGFAKAWKEALSEAFATLELLLLERALSGAGGDVVARGDDSRLGQLSERGQLALLNHYRQSVREYRAEVAAAEGRDLIAEEAAAREALEATLAEMKARMLGDV